MKWTCPLQKVDKVITFEGENSILERSIIIHADRDDFTTQPTGASGAKELRVE